MGATYSQVIQGNAKLSTNQCGSKIAFNCVKSICLVEKDSTGKVIGCSKMTKKELVEYVDFQTCKPSAVVTVNQKKYCVQGV